MVWLNGDVYARWNKMSFGWVWEECVWVCVLLFVCFAYKVKIKLIWKQEIHFAIAPSIVIASNQYLCFTQMPRECDRFNWMFKCFFINRFEHFTDKNALDVLSTCDWIVTSLTTELIICSIEPHLGVTFKLGLLWTSRDLLCSIELFISFCFILFYFICIHQWAIDNGSIELEHKLYYTATEGFFASFWNFE